MNQRQKILEEVIRLFEGSTGPTKGGQILSLDVIELLRITHKQPDRSCRRIFLDALRIEGSSYLSLLERFQIAIDAPVRSGVALIFDFLPKSQAVVFPILPTFEDIGSKWVKGTLLLASFLGFGKGTLLEPVSNRAITQPNSPRNLFGRSSLTAEFHDLVISRISARTSGETDFLHVRWFWRSPFLDRDDGLVLLAAVRFVWFCFS